MATAKPWAVLTWHTLYGKGPRIDLDYLTSPDFTYDARACRHIGWPWSTIRALMSLYPSPYQLFGSNGPLETDAIIAAWADEHHPPGPGQ